MTIKIEVSNNDEVVLRAYAENFEIAEQKLEQLKNEYIAKEERGEFNLTQEQLTEPH
jgi:hypothetical protein